MNPLENMKIRPLKKEDLETIIEIDEKILGRERVSPGIYEIVPKHFSNLLRVIS